MASLIDAYKEINHEITPEVLGLFRRKQNNHTTGEHFLLLGAKGQFAELNKKFWKLYAAIWTGEVELIGEDVEEVASDMIGHLLLLIYSVRRDGLDGPSGDEKANAHEGGSEPMSAQLSVRSGPGEVEARSGIPGPPRCGSCEDCRSSEPVWCGAWSVPNEYAMSNMTVTQTKRMKVMYGSRVVS